MKNLSFQLTMSWRKKNQLTRGWNYAAMLLLILTLSTGQTWAEDGVLKKIPKDCPAQDTAYIITPTISTQDTIFTQA